MRVAGNTVQGTDMMDHDFTIEVAPDVTQALDWTGKHVLVKKCLLQGHCCFLPPHSLTP